MVRLGYSSTRKESGLGCTKVYWVIFIRTMLGFGPWGPLCLNLLCWDASRLVSDESSTRMASLEEGNWILRGTREVTTAGTLVAFGLEVSGLLLDLLLDELGSEGGRNTWHLDPNTAELLRSTATTSDPTRALLSVPSKSLQWWTEDQCSTILPQPTMSSQVGY